MRILTKAQKKNQSETSRLLREKRKLLGICAKCGKEKPKKPFLRCAKCLKKLRESMRKLALKIPRYWADRRRKYVSTHKRKIRKYNKIYNPKRKERAIKEYLRRKKLGICTRCGKNPKDPGFLKCHPCRMIWNAWNREYHQKRRKRTQEILDRINEKIRVGILKEFQERLNSVQS